MILILANYMSWHRAVDEVTPGPGTEQLRDLLAPKGRGHLSLASFYFIQTEPRFRQIILFSSVNVVLLQESWN